MAVGSRRMSIAVQTTTHPALHNSKDKHRFYDFNISLPGGATVTGIEVRLDAFADSTSSAPKMCVQLSWDGGTTWTTAKQTPTLTTSQATYILGSPVGYLGPHLDFGQSLEHKLPRSRDRCGLQFRCHLTRLLTGLDCGACELLATTLSSRICNP